MNLAQNFEALRLFYAITSSKLLTLCDFGSDMFFFSLWLIFEIYG